MFYIDLEYDTDLRYDMAKFLEYDTTNEKYNTLNSYFLQELIKLSPAGTIMCAGERPEMTSYKIYTDTQFYQILMYYNGKNDFENDGWTLGTTIKYPSLTDLETLLFTLKAREKAINS